MKTNNARTTVLVISMGFLFLYLVFSWKWAVYVSFAVGASGAISLYLSGIIEWIWLKLAYILGQIIPNILLTMLFFLFLTPIALFSRLFNKDPLMLSKKYSTHFIGVYTRDHKESFRKTW